MSLFNRKKPAVCPSSVEKRKNLLSRGQCLDSQKCRQKTIGWKGIEAQNHRFNIWEKSTMLFNVHTLFSSLPKTVQTEHYSYSSYPAQTQWD